MIRTSVDSVVQQLTNDGRFMLKFMSVAAAGDMKEFEDNSQKCERGSSVQPHPKTEKRSPAVATDLVFNMSVLSLGDLSLLSDRDSKSFRQRTALCYR